MSAMRAGAPAMAQGMQDLKKVSPERFVSYEKEGQPGRNSLSGSRASFRSRSNRNKLLGEGYTPKFDQEAYGKTALDAFFKPLEDIGFKRTS